MSKNGQTKNKKKLIQFFVITLLFLVSVMASFFILRFVIPHDTEGGSDTVQTADNSSNPKEEELPSSDDWTVAPEKPRYLSIDRLNIVNARVVELGTAGEDNQLEDPKNIHDAGWYRESALPGAPFDTAYAGLYDGHNTGISQKGIFYSLDKLVIGDIIKIERGDGTMFNYAVREVEAPLVEEVDMEKMQKSFNPSVEGLNIITCGGEWDKERQTYTHRVTVRATIQ